MLASLNRTQGQSRADVFAASDRSRWLRAIGADERQVHAEVSDSHPHAGRVRSELTNINLEATGPRSLVTNNCRRSGRTKSRARTTSTTPAGTRGSERSRAPVWHAWRPAP